MHIYLRAVIIGTCTFIHIHAYKFSKVKRTGKETSSLFKLHERERVQFSIHHTYIIKPFWNQTMFMEIFHLTFRLYLHHTTQKKKVL